MFIRLALAFGLWAPAAAQADTLALDFEGGVAAGSGFRTSFVAELTLGWSFTVNQPIAVTGLGFFDNTFSLDHDGAEGLLQDHVVSLWTSGGALLAQTTVTSASTSVTSTADEGRWLFNDISPVALAVGDYVIGALDPICRQTQVNDCDTYRHTVTATGDLAITFLNAVSAVGDAFPTDVVANRNDGYFGPNFAFEALPTTEPHAAALLGVGLAGVLLAARRRRATGAAAG